jgi:hypothetical protein
MWFRLLFDALFTRSSCRPARPHRLRPQHMRLCCEVLAERIVPALGNPLQTFADPGGAGGD